MRLVVPDLVSPSYFPAIAAVELGLMRDEGLDVELELLFPVTDAATHLREGEIDFLAGAAHAPLSAFSNWDGAKLAMALSQNMYWFLVVRSELELRRGDLGRLGGLRIGAAPGPDLGLIELLREAGVDMQKEGIEIVPVPMAAAASVSFGVTAADALEQGFIDGFWANGMGAEVAVRRRSGTVVLDARRGDGPPAAASFTFPALIATDTLIERRPEAVEAAIRSIVRAQRMLRAHPDRAGEVGERLFPPLEAALIPELVRRDLPYYEPQISRVAVEGLNRFAQRAGLIEAPAAYGDVVATALRSAWTA